MQDSEIIWKYLMRHYPNDHQAVYLYASGNKVTQTFAAHHVTQSLEPIFSSGMTKIRVVSVIKEYLEYKKKQYVKGEIKIKPLY